MKKFFTLCLLLTFLSTLPLLAAKRYVTANLNLRMEPTTKSSVLTVIPRGTAVEIDEDCDCQWILVQYGNHIGYVSSKYLSHDAFACFQSTHPSKTSSRYYTNVDGIRVQSPTYYSSAPAGATALCRDGTYSYSRNRRGTCSHHGGVQRWL